MSEEKKIPPAIAKTLQASLRRIRRIVAFRGVCVTLAVLIASVLAIMAVDAMVTIYSNWVRWLLWCGALAGTGTVAWMSLIKPLMRKITLVDVALLIERNHPELEERLSTVVELAEEGRSAEVWSKELVNEITKNALNDIGKVSPKKEFTSRTIKPRFLAAFGAVFVLAGLFAAFPTATARLVARALLPSAEVDNIYASSLKVAPGDQVLLAGSPFKVSLAVDGGFPSKAFVRTSVNGKSEAVERMVRTTEEEAKGPVFYEFDYPSVTESFTYRVNCGSALTKAYNVKVVPTPTFENRKIRIEHPEYTGRAPTEYTNSAQIVGVAGSKVTIIVDKPREDITGYITLPGDRVIEGADNGFDNKLEFKFDLGADADGMWTAMAQDSNGFSNRVENAAVTVVKDTPPTVEIVVPTESEVKLPRTGILPIEFRARDDFKLSKAVIEIAAGAADYTDLQEISFAPGADGWQLGSENISIMTLSKQLGKSAAAQFRIRVEDNLPAELGGPGVARSASVLVELVTQGQGKSLGRQELAKQIEETKKEAADIRKILVSAQNHLEVARNCYKSYQNAWSLNEGKKRHGLCKADITNAEGLFAAFIQDLRDTRLSTGAAILQPVMDKHLIPVRQEIEDLYLVDPTARYEPSKKAYHDFVELMKAYDAALKKYEILTKTAEDMQKMEDLKEQQEALAEAAKDGEMSPQELSDAEKKLMDEMNELMSQDMQRNLDKEIKKAEELAKKAEELSQKQQEIKEKMSGEEQKKAEDQLKSELGKLADDTQKLTEDVQKQTGTSEMDEDKTTEPLESSKSAEESAKDSAAEASKDLADQKIEDAKADMDDVMKALQDAQKQLGEAKDRMQKANERFAKEKQEMDEMMQKLNEAMQAAMDAAKAELGDMPDQQPMSQEEMQQMAQEMAQQEKMTEEQLKAMLEGMKQAMEEMKKMSAEMMKQMMEQLKDQLGKLSPEDLKNAMKQAMEQMKAELGKAQKQQMAEKMDAAAQEMGKMEMGKMEQMSMDPQAFKPQSPEMQMQQMQMQMQQMQMQMPQMPQQQQQQMQQQMQQMQQQMQQMQQQMQQSQDAQQPQQQNSPGPTSNIRENLGEDEGVDWFRMKSSSSSGAEADPMDDVPSEYRGLVRDYFKALNAGGKK